MVCPRCDWFSQYLVTLALVLALVDVVRLMLVLGMLVTLKLMVLIALVASVLALSWSSVVLRDRLSARAGRVGHILYPLGTSEGKRSGTNCRLQQGPLLGWGEIILRARSTKRGATTINTVSRGSSMMPVLLLLALRCALRRDAWRKAHSLVVFLSLYVHGREYELPRNIMRRT